MNQITDNSDSGIDSSTILVTKPYRMHARVAWIIMAIVAVIAVIPFLGFASWLVAGPMLLVSFIMIILVFSKGGVAHGLALLACQIVVMPLIVIFGPFISSAIGLVGTVSAIEGAGQLPVPPVRVPTYVPQASPSAITPPSEPVSPRTESPIAASLVLPESLRVLKSLLHDQQPSVTAWLSKGLALETATGYLKPGDSADIDSRRAIQQQNVWREKTFEQIATLTGKSPDEVAKTYARLASGAGK